MDSGTYYPVCDSNTHATTQCCDINEETEFLRARGRS